MTVIPNAIMTSSTLKLATTLPSIMPSTLYNKIKVLKIEAEFWLKNGDFDFQFFISEFISICLAIEHTYSLNK